MVLAQVPQVKSDCLIVLGVNDVLQDGLPLKFILFVHDFLLQELKLRGAVSQWCPLNQLFKSQLARVMSHVARLNREKLMAGGHAQTDVTDSLGAPDLSLVDEDLVESVRGSLAALP